LEFEANFFCFFPFFGPLEQASDARSYIYIYVCVCVYIHHEEGKKMDIT